MNRTKKVLTVKENHMFSKIYGKGRSFVSKSIVLYVLKNYNKKETRIGISVSKKRGNAVKRNRMRRIIRESFRQLYPRVRKGYLLVVVARQACENSNSVHLKDELDLLLKKAALYMENEEKSALK